jgi:Mg-chelatase subunit ChlI
MGLRGQAKQLLAKMIELLDEYIPLCCGFRINDDPADGS